MIRSRLRDWFGSTTDTTGSAETDGGTRASRGEAAGRLGSAYDPDPERLTPLVGDEATLSTAQHQLTAQLTLGGDDVETLVEEYRGAGVGRDPFVETQAVARDALVEAAFDTLRDTLDTDAQDTIDAVQAELRRELDALTQRSRTGLAAFDSGTTATEPTPAESSGETGFSIDFHDVLHHIGTPLFVLDADGDILTWNSSLAELTGVDETEAKSMEMASMAFYPDGRRAKTLADKVLDAPEQTHTEYDVPKVDSADFTLYRDTSVMQDQYGEDRHISFSAAPIYEDGEVVAVVEMVQDRTAEAERHSEITALVEELSTTMQALERGDLDARASVDSTEYIDEALLDVVDSLNNMAENHEALTKQVDAQTAELASAIDQTASAARTVEQQVEQQAESLATAADNVQDVSAGMQEVAATSNEVASSADRALSAAEDGAAASETVQEVTDTLTETSEDLVESVTDLESRMDEVGEIVDVIADVAEQTNMLALNANIEAARAGESGSGFAVVADEVKSLANETSDHAAEISNSIDAIQAQATETADMVETSHEQVQRAESEIGEALSALDEISDAVESAATGIQEVAEANDDQAGAIEDITSTIEDAREHAREAEDATDQIVAATDQQTAAVEELVARVEELSDEGAGTQ
ncbi:methyl-accepting chemotaxis protein [Haloarcula halophila]|uniref:methyl-accepting chemotaxis protein n=1 Tax=Haloarcula TaxID=2237 RepID=UPI0023E466D3|nr:methyl-accepting chemotaxis protein [Halomicroarcula sp. DFY41]